jgi:hypothetical protein
MKNIINIKSYPYKSWTIKFPDYNVSIDTLVLGETWKLIIDDANKDKINNFLSHC